MFASRFDPARLLRNSPVRQRLAVGAVYVFTTLVMAGPIVNYSALGTASYAGDSRLIIWTLAWDNHAVLTRQPLFDSNVFYPARRSLVYNEHLFGISLFTLPIYAVSRNPVLAYNCVWLLAFVLNAAATHALLRRYHPSHLAAMTGSFIFTFSFYKMLHAHGHLQQVWTWLLPLSVLYLERWHERPSLRRALLWALVVVLQALGSLYVAVMTLVTQAFMMFPWVPGYARARRLPALRQIGVASAIAAAALWPFTAPYRELAPTQVKEAAANSADLAAYLVPPQNTWAGAVWRARIGDGPRWIWGEQTLFIGWLALALAGFGVWTMFRSGRWRLLFAYGSLVAFALALSFGPAITRHGESWSAYSVFASVPGLSAFRAPARFALLVLFGVSVFAAGGAQRIVDTFRFGGVALVLAWPLMLSEWYLVGFPGGKPQPFAVPRIYRSEALVNANAIVSLPDYRGTPDWALTPDYMYFSTVHWRPIVNGYGRSEPAGHQRVTSHMNAFPGPNNAQTMRALGIEYIVLHTARFPGGASEIVRLAQNSPEYDLAGRDGPDYLFRVRPLP